MIVKGTEFRRKAYMVSAPKAASLTEVESGQLVALDASGNVIKCTGATKGFICVSDLNAKRDNVTDHGGVISYAMGPFATTVDSGSFDSGETYAFGTRLMSNADGKLTPIVEGTTSEALVCAIALGAAVNNTLRIGSQV